MRPATIYQKNYVLLLMALLLLQLAGCDNRSRLRPLPPDGTILAFGDSLTYGTGAAAEASYPSVLAAATGFNVINAGIPGEVTANGRQRLPQLLQEHRPALVILCHGGNDMLRQRGEEQARDNLRAMALMARESGADVILIGVPRAGVFLSSAPFYGELAEELDLPLENDILGEILSDRSLKSDRIHPNAEGYRLLAGAIEKLLADNGAL